MFFFKQHKLYFKLENIEKDLQLLKNITDSATIDYKKEIAFKIKQYDSSLCKNLFYSLYDRCIEPTLYLLNLLVYNTKNIMKKKILNYFESLFDGKYIYLKEINYKESCEVNIF